MGLEVEGKLELKKGSARDSVGNVNGAAKYLFACTRSRPRRQACQTVGPLAPGQRMWAKHRHARGE